MDIKPPKKPKLKKEHSAHSDVAQLKRQITELTEGLARERADATNVRRRADEEREIQLELPDGARASSRQPPPHLQNRSGKKHAPDSQDRIA